MSSISRTARVGSSGSVSITRSAVFIVLTLASIGLLLYSWFQPWWQAHIVALDKTAVIIRPWGLVSYMPAEYSKWLVGAEMPSWFAPLMWVYLGVGVGALVYSLFVSQERVALGKLRMPLPKLLIGGVGLSYIVFVLVCVAIIAIRAREFYGASVMGSVFVSMSGHEMSDVDTRLLAGYWLAAAVGPLLVILALFREKILGQRKAMR